MARDPLLPPSGRIRRGGRWRPVGWPREEGDGGSNGGTEDGGRRRAAAVARPRDGRAVPAAEEGDGVNAGVRWGDAKL